LPADRLTAGYAGIDVQELHIWSPWYRLKPLTE
jgi:hypothetical protein